MLETLAIENYRSIRSLRVPLAPINVITGANGTGKSNLYRALRLLAETAQGGVVASLAREGGLRSAFWAGPEQFSREMKTRKATVQGTSRKEAKRLRLGFGSEEFSYAVAFGLPTPSSSIFSLDPELKYEGIWFGKLYKPGGLLVERKNSYVKARGETGWQDLSTHLSLFESIFSQIADPNSAAPVLLLREHIRKWRFYDQFRTDPTAPARGIQLGTRTPVLHHDGRDLASAVATIREEGDWRIFEQTISQAFPGARVDPVRHESGSIELLFFQEGLLRSLSTAELSDGTLRFLLWAAALLTPHPPMLMVLNEPETSMHPDLIPALSELILHAGTVAQVWIVSHSAALISQLSKSPQCSLIELEKDLGETVIPAQGLVNKPAWKWPIGC